MPLIGNTDKSKLLEFVLYLLRHKYINEAYLGLSYRYKNTCLDDCGYFALGLVYFQDNIYHQSLYNFVMAAEKAFPDNDSLCIHSSLLITKLFDETFHFEESFTLLQSIHCLFLPSSLPFSSVPEIKSISQYFPPVHIPYLPSYFEKLLSIIKNIQNKQLNICFRQLFAKQIITSEIRLCTHILSLLRWIQFPLYSRLDFPFKEEINNRKNSISLLSTKFFSFFYSFIKKCLLLYPYSSFLTVFFVEFNVLRYFTLPSDSVDVEWMISLLKGKKTDLNKIISENKNRNEEKNNPPLFSSALQLLSCFSHCTPSPSLFCSYSLLYSSIVIGIWSLSPSLLMKENNKLKEAKEEGKGKEAKEEGKGKEDKSLYYLAIILRKKEVSDDLLNQAFSSLYYALSLSPHSLEVKRMLAFLSHLQRILQSSLVNFFSSLPSLLRKECIKAEKDARLLLSEYTWKSQREYKKALINNENDYLTKLRSAILEVQILEEETEEGRRWIKNLIRFNNNNNNNNINNNNNNNNNNRVLNKERKNNTISDNILINNPLSTPYNYKQQNSSLSYSANKSSSTLSSQPSSSSSSSSSYNNNNNNNNYNIHQQLQSPLTNPLNIERYLREEWKTEALQCPCCCRMMNYTMPCKYLMKSNNMLHLTLRLIGLMERIIDSECWKYIVNATSISSIIPFKIYGRFQNECNISLTIAQFINVFQLQKQLLLRLAAELFEKKNHIVLISPSFYHLFHCTSFFLSHFFVPFNSNYTI